MSRLSRHEEDYLIMGYGAGLTRDSSLLFTPIGKLQVNLKLKVNYRQTAHYQNVQLLRREKMFGQHLPGNGGWRRAESAAVHDEVHSLDHWILLRLPRQYPRSHV